jgi:hypothetical protein
MHSGQFMRGVITSRDVISNAGLICREFGVGCVFRCIAAVLARRKTTFLEIAVRCL